MKGLIACSLALAILASSGWSATGEATEMRTHKLFEVKPGDRIRVVGAPLGCRVARMKQLGGRIVVDCRRAGALSGTFGTLLSAREAVLVRFESRTTAKRVTVGTHERGAESCR